MSTQINIQYGGRAAGKTVKQQTWQSLTKQIAALEFVMSKGGIDQKRMFALNGKIKRLKKDLSDLEWLGR